jgi:hypothetical protein
VEHEEPEAPEEEEHAGDLGKFEDHSATDSSAKTHSTSYTD